MKRLLSIFVLVWISLAVTGLAFAVPVGDFQGDWDNDGNYEVSDVVYHEGSSYIALQISSGIEPGSDPTKWHLLAQGGTGGGAAVSVGLSEFMTGGGSTAGLVGFDMPLVDPVNGRGYVYELSAIGRTLTGGNHKAVVYVGLIRRLDNGQLFVGGTALLNSYDSGLQNWVQVLAVNNVPVARVQGVAGVNSIWRIDLRYVMSAV